jgi:AcrR family transcriptional regulator
VTVTSGKRLDPQARRAQLIGLGLEHLRTHPGEISAVDRIAEAAGISRSLLFHYFPTKKDYRVAVVRAAADLLLAVTDVEPGSDPLDRLHRSLRSFITFIEENGVLYSALVRGAAGGGDDLQAIFDETRERFVDRIAEGLGLAERSPVMRTALRGWVGSVEEATLDYLRHGDIDREALVALFERSLVRTVEIATSL